MHCWNSSNLAFLTFQNRGRPISGHRRPHQYDLPLHFDEGAVFRRTIEHKHLIKGITKRAPPFCKGLRIRQTLFHQGDGKTRPLWPLVMPGISDMRNWATSYQWGAETAPHLFGRPSCRNSLRTYRKVYRQRSFFDGIFDGIFSTKNFIIKQWRGFLEQFRSGPGHHSKIPSIYGSRLYPINVGWSTSDEYRSLFEVHVWV